MATLRQYYETDFSNAIRVHVTIAYGNDEVEGVLLYDVSAYTAYLSCYLPGSNRQYDDLIGLLHSIKHGQTQLKFTGQITLPAVKQFPGELQINKHRAFEMRYRLFGDPEWRSTSDISSTSRVFLYSETNLEDSSVRLLQDTANSLGYTLQFRSTEYIMGRSKFEIPLAFISHDSRDKESVARMIAINLQGKLCPVWYDEFSLKIGDNLRESIENGLKECRKCVLILSPNFISNNGWTKREFDAIFTREILEESQLVLPVWHGVSKQDVYNYSPSLLNVKGLDWKTVGEEEVCRLLYNAITSESSETA